MGLIIQIEQRFSLECMAVLAEGAELVIACKL